MNNLERYRQSADYLLQAESLRKDIKKSKNRLDEIEQEQDELEQEYEKIEKKLEEEQQQLLLLEQQYFGVKK